jgi:hypothetical protein
LENTNEQLVSESPSKITFLAHWKNQQLMGALKTPQFNWRIHLKEGSTPQIIFCQSTIMG